MSLQVLERFCVAGINYHSANTDVRGLFAITKEDFTRIAEKARQLHLRSVFVVSTCNRTEIYGYAEHVNLLAQLLTAHTKGSLDSFLEHAYLLSGAPALQHLFRVAAGLDSQILGDYEILGQLKLGLDMAQEKDMIGPLMNRTVSYALQASKKIKTETALSTGTVSVSYAAIELLREEPGIASKKVLVVGAGKFGRNVCRNLKSYLPGTTITITNRTDETAKRLADIAGVDFLPYSLLEKGLQEADVIVVCTHAAVPVILPAHFTATDKKLVLDLSVPVNVHPQVKQIKDIRVIDVDEISATILDKTFAQRKREMPKAEAIIAQYMQEYFTWLHEYRYSLHIKNWKDKLQELHGCQPSSCCEMATQAVPPADEQVQKAVSRLAVNLRTSSEKGCVFINAINDYLQMSRS